MIDIQTIKSGDRVIYNFGIPLRLADGTSISNGDVLIVAKPARLVMPDNNMKSVFLLNVEIPGSPMMRTPLNPMFFDLAGDGAGEPDGCKCDLRGPNMWLGCRCGFAAKEKCHS